MTDEFLEMVRQILFWPGETLGGWLEAAYPQIATWLGLHTTSNRGLFATFVTLLAGWMVFNGTCHVLLFGMRRWEARQASRPAADPGAAPSEADT